MDKKDLAKQKFPLWKIEGDIDNQMITLKFSTKMSRTLYNELMDHIYEGLPEHGSLPVGVYTIRLEKEL